MGGQLPYGRQKTRYNQPQQVERENGFSTKQMLDAYIYDFLSKSSLKNSAAAFCREAGLVGSDGVPRSPSILDEVKDAPQGFIYEWWQIFWDLFNARTHKEGSTVAKEYTKILSDKQKQEYAYRSHAVQAARMQHMAVHGNESPTSSGFSPFVSPMAGMHPTPSYHNSNNPPLMNEMNSNPREYNVSAPFQYAPPALGSEAPGWPGYPNQVPPFTNQSYGTRHDQHSPYPTSNPQITAPKAKVSRPPPTKHTAAVDVPGSPNHTSPAGSYMGSGSSLAGRISVMEGLHNYQRQMIMSEIEYNNQNRKANSPVAANGATYSKKRMLRPSACLPPQNGPSTTESYSNLNMMNNSSNPSNSKPKPVRRRSANSNIGPVTKSMQTSYSESPSTPISAGHAGTVNDTNERVNRPNSLSTVSEIAPSSGNELTDSSKKTGKKVRKQKKALAITFSNNGFSFVPPNSVPTPPNEAQQKSQFRVLGKNHVKKSQNARSSNKFTSKGSAEASPQVMGDESSMTTPTFVNTMWQNSGKMQSTPHSNFTFVGEGVDLSNTVNGPSNTNSAIGSGSGTSYQYNEGDQDELLSINSMLSMSDVTGIKGEVDSNQVLPSAESATSLQESAQHEFNLDLLEPGEPSFNFLSPRN